MYMYVPRRDETSPAAHHQPPATGGTAILCMPMGGGGFIDHKAAFVVATESLASDKNSEFALGPEAGIGIYTSVVPESTFAALRIHRQLQTATNISGIIPRLFVGSVTLSQKFLFVEIPTPHDHSRFDIADVGLPRLSSANE